MKRQRDHDSSPDKRERSLNELSIPAQVRPSPINTSKWPLLLKNYDKLLVRSGHFHLLNCGNSPLARPLEQHLQYGVIALDKPVNPSSHEVAAWIARILKIQKSGHGGTLDPKVSGVLIVCLNKATRLAKANQNAGKEYVAVCQFASDPGGRTAVTKALEGLTGALFQRPPKMCAVKRQLRIRTVYSSKLLDYDEKTFRACFHVACEAGTYIRTYCVHLGLVLGVGATMAELRRVKSGHMSENGVLSTMHDVLDAQYHYETHLDDSYLRRVVLPVEILLTNHKRIVVKDSSVNALCYGAKLVAPGVLRFDPTISVGDEVVFITVRGEAVALGIAQITASALCSVDHGVVAIIKRVIMDRDTYTGKWGCGPYSIRKKELIALGHLDSHGRITKDTPPEIVLELGKSK